MFQGNRRSSSLSIRHYRLLQFLKGISLFAVIGVVFALIALPQSAKSLQTAASVQILTTPALNPPFDPNITDYVVGASADDSLQFSVSAPRNTKVSVDGQLFRSFVFTQRVDNFKEGQSLPFKVSLPSGVCTYYVRRLPANFPGYLTERPGVPQAAYYVFAPNIRRDFGELHNYVIVADNFGVPLWWYQKSPVPIDAKFLPDGKIGWLTFAQNPSVGEIRTLDGKVTQTLQPKDGFMDNHELTLLPNGNYLYIVGVVRGPVDLSAYGGSATANVLDNVIEEVTPKGEVVWRWSSMDHIDISETEPNWRQNYLVYSSPADPYHMNSVELDGTGYVMSLRHLNAVIRIDRATGARLWKLGGSYRGGAQGPESLRFVRDPNDNFGGQHDARILPDGTLTVHDNGTTFGRAPRAVRYRIDENAHTAQWLEQVTDKDAPDSWCCGSARKLPKGDWVTEWGQNAMVTELDQSGKVVLRLRMKDPFFSYRCTPVLPGVIKREDLRKGMDMQYPREMRITGATSTPFKVNK